MEFKLVDLDPQATSTGEREEMLNDLGRQGWKIETLLPIGNLIHVVMSRVARR